MACPKSGGSSTHRMKAAAAFIDNQNVAFDRFAASPVRAPPARGQEVTVNFEDGSELGTFEGMVSAGFSIARN
jgi:hypothetical protein